jgi:hypothetical protein
MAAASAERWVALEDFFSIRPDIFNQRMVITEGRTAALTTWDVGGI